MQFRTCLSNIIAIITANFNEECISKKSNVRNCEWEKVTGSMSLIGEFTGGTLIADCVV